MAYPDFIVSSGGIDDRTIVKVGNTEFELCDFKAIYYESKFYLSVLMEAINGPSDKNEDRYVYFNKNNLGSAIYFSDQTTNETTSSYSTYEALNFYTSEYLMQSFSGLSTKECLNWDWNRTWGGDTSIMFKFDTIMQDLDKKYNFLCCLKIPDDYNYVTISFDFSKNKNILKKLYMQIKQLSKCGGTQLTYYDASGIPHKAGL